MFPDFCFKTTGKDGWGCSVCLVKTNISYVNVEYKVLSEN